MVGETDQPSHAVLMPISTAKPEIIQTKVLLFVFIAWAVVTGGKNSMLLIRNIIAGTYYSYSMNVCCCIK